MHLLGAAAGEFGETTARRAPVRNNRHVPAHAIERFHHLRRWCDISDEEQCIGAGILQAGELRHHVDVGGLEFLDAGVGNLLGIQRAFSPFSLDSPHELLMRIMPGFLAPNFLAA